LYTGSIKNGQFRDCPHHTWLIHNDIPLWHSLGYSSCTPAIRVMLTNYFRIAWRNLRKDRQFTLLNLLGLSTGLACSLLLYLWIADELTVDKFNEKDSQLYQVMVNFKTDNGVKTGWVRAALANPSDSLRTE